VIQEKYAKHMKLIELAQSVAFVSIVVNLNVASQL
jgi:hypothetical protein